MRSSMLVKLALCLLCVFFVGSSLPAGAQSTDTGTVVGTVSDPTGAVVPDVNVTLTDKATNQSRSVTSNNAGLYIFVNVASGEYDMTFAKPGFATTRAPSQRVKVGLATTVNISLQVGAASIQIEVTTVGTELQTMNATVGNTITGISLDSLPSMNRDVSTFVSLQPGVSPDGSVAGAVVDQSSFYLDGGNNTNDMDGSMSVYTASFAGDATGGVANQSNNVAAGPSGVVPTPADSVEEFKVNTAGQTADFNSSAGAEVKVSTRRGTNAFHGSVYEYYLDNNFSANLWDNNLVGNKVPDWHRSRFGFRVGGPLLPNLLGGKTYFFFNYEGYRFPFSETRERAVPSADMRLGLLTFTDSVTKLTTTYNLNHVPVTSAEGVLYPANAGCAGFPGGLCDPRSDGGVNPLVQQVWSHMPLPNEAVGDCGLSRCDTGGNVTGFKFNLAEPQKSNIEVFRLDHDFGQKWHFMSSFRYFKLTTATHDEVNIGDLLGGKMGVGTSLSLAPQLPWFLVAGITTNVSSTTTNDFHYSFLRNWWAWARAGDVPQLSSLGGAIEPGGENRDQALIPYNVNTQQTRTRFWDGHDQMFRDDVSMLKGNHLFQFGGTYQHNFNWHQRTDNGGGINYEAVYQLGTSSGAGIDVSSFTPPNVSKSSWGRDYAEVLGLVSIAQIAYTRTGPTLTLNPKPRTPAFDKSTIPYYNVYFTDTWHLKKTFTLTYGLGWTLEMPPVEANGKQIELVDQANQLIDMQAYMHSREAAALKGEVYNPLVGFTLVGNSENGRKYPYNPFYGAFSPRVAAAWNPKASGGFMGSLLGDGATVVRAGYGRIYGRLNGVDLVLVPLLGTGLIQPVQCIGALRAGGGTCAGSSSGADPNTAFRIGTDGLTAPLPAAQPTLPQPLYPGVNGIAAGAGEALDPHFRPNVVNSIDFTIQRQLSRKISMEMGYIGRWIHNEYMPININAVPYMITIGGQSFAKAYAGVSQALGCTTSAGACGANIPAKKLNDASGNPTIPNPAYTAYFNSLPQQAFFTATLKPSYCTGAYAGVAFANCTAAAAINEVDNITGAAVWSLYSDLDNGGFDPNILPRSMMNTPLAGVNGGNGQLTSGVAVNASVGYGNYNAGFVSLKMSDWKGLTMQHNFTWSKALGTGASVQATSESTAPDPFNLRTGYGLQGFDRKFVYNFYFVYQPPFFTGQHGLAGHVLGGWTLAPIFTAGTGLPITVATANGGGQAFGEGDSVNFFGYGVSENAIPVGHVSTGVHKNYVGCSAPCLPNLFADPAAAFNNNFRQPVLGFDTRDGGFGVIRGLGYWNMDVSIKKNLKITERLNLEFSTVVANVFNHVNFFDPGPGSYLDTSIGPDPTAFGTLPGQATSSMAYGPRQFEFGIRLSF